MAHKIAVVNLVDSEKTLLTKALSCVSGYQLAYPTSIEIIPAVTCKNNSKNIAQYLVVSAVFPIFRTQNTEHRIPFKKNRKNIYSHNLPNGTERLFYSLWHKSNM